MMSVCHRIVPRWLKLRKRSYMMHPVIALMKYAIVVAIFGIYYTPFFEFENK
jgi:hypothetical protein